MADTKQDTFSGGALPMSQSGFLYQAMSKMSAYDIEMQNQWLEQQRQEAEVIGGIQTDETTGAVGFVVDGNGVATGGTVANFLDISFNAADSAGDASQDDAMASWVQFGAGVGGLGLTAIAYGVTKNSALNNQLKDAQALQRDLNSPADGAVVQMEDFNAPPGSDDVLAKQKIDTWASGDKSSFGNYQEDENGNPVDENTARINKRAAELARVVKHDAIAKNLDEYISRIQERIGQGSARLSTATQTATMIKDAAGAGGSAYYNTAKAGDQKDAGRASAIAEIQKQNWQQQIGYQTDAKQKADAFFQDAAAVAAGYGQIVNTHA